MPQFQYKAKKEDGSLVSGTLQAESERSALDSLGRMGVFPLEIQTEGGEAPRASAPVSAARRSGRRVRPDDVALFTRQLSDLLKAGVSMHKALATLREQTSNHELSEAVAAIGKAISEGIPLNEALARHPAIFPELYVNMVRAGEAGGFLEDVLKRLALFIEKDQELKSRVRSSLAYPTLLIVIGVGAVAFLMVFFIPRFSEIFRKMGGNLPLSTQIVMGVSTFVSRYWMAVLAGLLGLTFAWNQLVATLTGRRFVDRLKIRAPLFGDIVKKNAVSRFARTLGTLLKSGVPMLAALSISKSAMDNTVLMEDIDDAAEGVKQGRSLAEILRRSRYFPAMVVDMIAVGEEGGNLDDVLVNVADSYDLQVERAVRVFIALFEPALLLVMATLVGFIVISMLLPVFSLSSMVK